MCSQYGGVYPSIIIMPVIVSLSSRTIPVNVCVLEYVVRHGIGSMCMWLIIFLDSASSYHSFNLIILSVYTNQFLRSAVLLLSCPFVVHIPACPPSRRSCKVLWIRMNHTFCSIQWRPDGGAVERMLLWIIVMDWRQVLVVARNYVCALVAGDSAMVVAKVANPF